MMLKREIKRILSLLIAAIMVIGAVQFSSGFRQVKADDPPVITGSAEWVSMDWQTKGAWNGKYGESGYLLFGYESDLLEIDENDGANVNKDDCNAVSMPSYVDSYSIKSNRTNAYDEGVFVYPGAQTADTVLDIPAERTDITSKVRAVLGGWAPDGEETFFNYFWSDSRDLTFVINDDEEHLFTFYMSGDKNPNIFYVGITFFDLDDNVLLHKNQNDFAFGDAGICYLTFKVKGSFRMKFNDTNGVNGINGVFFDEPEPETPPTLPPADVETTVEFESMDWQSKGAWNGKYGTDGYILFGYETDPLLVDPIDGENINKDNYNAVLLPSYVGSYSIYSNRTNDPNEGVYVYPGAQNFNNVLDPPVDRSDLTSKIRAHLGGYKPDGGTDGTWYNYWWGDRSITFIITEEEEFLFTFYLSGSDNPNIFYSGIKFFDLDGNLVLEKTTGSEDFGAATDCYVTFRIQGSFKMQFNEVNGVNGINGVFFNPGAASPTEVPTEVPSDAPTAEPTAVPTVPPTPSTAEWIGMDWQTKGNWNGAYGKNGYILFGYGVDVANVDQTDGSNIDKNAFNIAEIPSYVNSYTISSGKESADGVYVYPGSQNFDNVLDIPAGRTDITAKIRAHLGGYKPDGGTDGTWYNYFWNREFTFVVDNEEEYLFSFYLSGTENPNIIFSGITFYDMAGNIILQKEQNGFEYGNAYDCYVTFKIKGSFRMNFNASPGLNGINGVFFDEVEKTPEVPVAVPSSAKFKAMDWWTRGAWNGEYGADGYILFGYEADIANVDQTDGANVNKDAFNMVELPSYVDSYTITSNRTNDPNEGVYVFPGAQEFDYVLDIPASRTDLTDKVRAALGGYKSDGGIESPGQYNYWWGDRHLTFVINDRNEHLFTFYMTGAENPNIYYSGIKFYDLDNNLILEKPRADFAYGDASVCYVSFRVRGSFRMQFDESAGINGINGVFFDESDALEGDINGDDQVDANDLAILLDDYGKAQKDSSSFWSDIDGDGAVDSADLSVLLDSYGQTY